jgi:glycosyltransferase involved in cell wall biosynthesis
MSVPTGSYVVITPARDEAKSLPRLAASLAGQTVLPERWLIVDNGSTDGTLAIAEELAREHGWIEVLTMPGTDRPVRGGAVVRAFHFGLAALPEQADIVVNLNADISFESDYFARLLGAFAADPKLGMVSGSCYEEVDGEWRQRHVTGTTVWGAARAYRRTCLDDVLPLEERMSWDGIDEMKAHAAGWHTTALTDLPFRHHREEGERDGSRRLARTAQGRAAHYIGYRPSYLVLRSLHHARREPSALFMIWGYASSVARREQQIADPAVRAQLRKRQSLRRIPVRAREALGRR